MPSDQLIWVFGITYGVLSVFAISGWVLYHQGNRDKNALIREMLESNAKSQLALERLGQTIDNQTAFFMRAFDKEGLKAQNK